VHYGQSIKLVTVQDMSENQNTYMREIIQTARVINFAERGASVFIIFDVPAADLANLDFSVAATFQEWAGYVSAAVSETKSLFFITTWPYCIAIFN